MEQIRLCREKCRIQILRRKFYFTERIQRAHEHGRKIISDLFNIYYNDPAFLPKEHRNLINHGKAKAIVIKDYIAGMTDKFAKEEWARLKQ